MINKEIIIDDLNINLENEKKFFEEIIEFIKIKKPKKQDLSNKKIILSKKYSLKKIPTDINILLNAKNQDLEYIKKYLLTKPSRTKSGVAVVAVMSYPYPCPHGECDMCSSMTKDNIPQSYTGKEPATMRGIRNDYNPYLQVINRLEQYIALGHNPQKIELIIMGGTFISFDKEYIENFVISTFKAMNDFSDLFYKKDSNNKIIFQIDKFKEFFMLPGNIYNKERGKIIKEKLLKNEKENKLSLEEEQFRNENSFVKCVGLTIETRPDYGKLSHANEMLKLGCTRVELGIQTVYDEVLEEINRGHKVQDSIESTKILKNLGFKINYHIMPGLPSVSKEKDLEGFKELFNNQNFRPDMLKIYPCMVLKNSKLYEKWKKGLFSPLDTKNASLLISEFKKYVPEYVRIMRVQRDIPSKVIEAGVDSTNLRQFIDKEKTCNCIRCREIGKYIDDKHKLEKIKFKTHVMQYNASDGKEFFISIEDKDKKILAGFVRMRFPSSSLREEITNNCALIRELHVYGDLTSIGIIGEVQHKGFGKQLMQKAEIIAKENNKNKIVVISGVGVRNYYRKLGYEKQGPYMVKFI
jgi:elongator complex protein 3